MGEESSGKFRGPLGINRGKGKRGRERKPGELGAVIAFEGRINLRTRAHHPGSDSRNLDPVARELGPESVGETNERELARAVGREMGHGYFPADR